MTTSLGRTFGTNGLGKTKESGNAIQCILLENW
jgi:hypothetical protein